MIVAMLLKHPPRSITCEDCGLGPVKCLLELRSEGYGLQTTI